MMELHEITDEVLRQRKVILDDGRRPESVRFHMEYQPDVYRLEQFVMMSPFVGPGHESYDDGLCGRLYGLKVYFDLEPGIRVRAQDDRGYGQGATR